ncbi:MAG: GH92 family glycosyl hydrolase [Bacteroidia bacterium]|nr:GH92 family glycosyl hydrolase [Bacteroidia bacterium]
MTRHTLMKSLSTFLVVFSSLFLTFPLSAAKKDFTKYVDPKIGNVSQLLVPTFPTFSLPNQMVRMFPIKADYIADQVTAWPLQVESHREAGFMRMKVSLGEITNTTWNAKMAIDHDLEVVRPWLYSTYLIDDDITVSFAPAKKCAIYKIDFPASGKKNILFSGTNTMKAIQSGENGFMIEETLSYKVRGITPVMRTMSAYCYAELTDENGNALKNLQLIPQNNRLTITSTATKKETILIKYAISYISFDQAKKNFALEIADQRFDQTTTNGKLAWDKVINQVEVSGGTEAQKRSFYTSLYRTYERMVDINEYGQYYSGYDGKVHQSDRPFFVDDWTWDTFLAKHPLNAVLNPTMEGDQLHSYVQMYEQSGWMPTFPEALGNHLCMNAYHSSLLFIDAYRKGITGFDVDKAYEGVKKNLTELHFDPAKRKLSRWWMVLKSDNRWLLRSE